MKKSFALGAAAGVSSLALAIPLLAQMAGAQTSSTPSIAPKVFDHFVERPAPTVENVQAMIDRDTKLLANIDAFVVIQKQATQAHKDALTAALSITDEAQRKTAVEAAHKAMHESIKSAIDANPDLQGIMMPMGMGMHMKHHGRGPGIEDLLTKLGMTEAEFKAAIESGKTPQDIATEKGIELPTPPMRKMKWQHKFDAAAPADSSAASVQ